VASINDELDTWRKADGMAATAAQLPQLITLQEFCALTSTADSTARQWIDHKMLNALVGPNGRIRIPLSEIARVFRPKFERESMATFSRRGALKATAHQVERQEKYRHTTSTKTSSRQSPATKRQPRTTRR